MTEKPGYWAVLPSQVRYDPSIPPNAKLLYAEISALTDMSGYCFATNAYFEQLYALSERTISRLISVLESAGYIRIEGKSGGREQRRIYAGINPLQGASDKATDTHRQKCLYPPSELSIPLDKNVTPNNNKKSISNPPKAPQGAGAGYVPKEEPDWKPDRFAAFWKYYPLHKSKQACIKAWDKLKPSDELLAVIGRALKRQIAEAKAEAEREHRPFEWKLHASTFLNGARWTDEVSETQDNEPPERRLAGARC